ncbi:hypothetical protein [Streptomyces sp. ICC1]|uniref:hypothetical protein n=1 Tax=Streptomyces sp. ICC1 TaxID=2099583 RepID=UPI000DC7674F|nr:hypothetical protein [Streptomyces sp. ICC1]AWZ17610.1 hypothetical protein DRB96_42455 [Streptomyces sp. ICC1]
MALMGFDVRYLEEPHSEMGGFRMTAWHTDPTVTARTADGTNRTTQNALAPGYERLIVTHSPTRSGQHQKDLPLDIRKDAQKHADWHRDDKLAKHLALTETNDEAALSRPKGFTDEDLANIDAYLRHGDPGAGLHDTTRQAVEALAVRAAAIDTSDDAQRDAIAREFASLLAGLPDHERLDALRARNIYAQSVAHLLQSPALSGPAADAPETAAPPTAARVKRTAASPG